MTITALLHRRSARVVPATRVHVGDVLRVDGLRHRVLADVSVTPAFRVRLRTDRGLLLLAPATEVALVGAR
jgi:hypothetical protein